MRFYNPPTAKPAGNIATISAKALAFCAKMCYDKKHVIILLFRKAKDQTQKKPGRKPKL